jgi:hypothetical protein
MTCIKCSADLAEGSVFCHVCGRKQKREQQTRKRGNGEGSVYKRGNKWVAVRTLGYYYENGKSKRKTVSKYFDTSREAVKAVGSLLPTDNRATITFAELYEKWKPTHSHTSRSTQNCYAAAYKHFAPLWDIVVSDIYIDDLQECVDDCGKGRRTQENMKALCGLLYKFGIPRGYVSHRMNLAEYLKVGGTHGTKEALSLEQLDKIKSLGTLASDYIYCACYLGFRPSEMLSLKIEDYNRKHRYLKGGSKTDAGINRIVTISPKIQPIIDRLTEGKEEGYIFCNESGEQLSLYTYRERFFYPSLEAAGIDNPADENGRKKYSPHSCRHTFANLIKGIDAADKDKLELIGHTSTEMLRHYQSVGIIDLQRITDAI